jgi:hypothetical protein
VQAPSGNGLVGVGFILGGLAFDGAASSGGGSPGIGFRFSMFLLPRSSTGLAMTTENKAIRSMSRKARILDLCDGATWEGERKKKEFFFDRSIPLPR